MTGRPLLGVICQVALAEAGASPEAGDRRADLRFALLQRDVLVLLLPPHGHPHERWKKLRHGCGCVGRGWVGEGSERRGQVSAPG